MEPRRPVVVFWGVATGAAAAIMLVAGGADALNGLQAITIIAGLPFMIVMIGIAVALVRDLNTDPIIVRRRYAVEAINTAVVEGVRQHGDDFVLAISETPPGEGVGARVDTPEPETEEEFVEDEATPETVTE